MLSRPRARRGVRARAFAAPAVVAAVSAGVFALVGTSLIDDTYITLAYARNLAFDLHWGLIEGLTSNTATSPLNVILLAAGTAVLRDPVLALAALFVLCNVVTFVALRRACRDAGLPAWTAPLAVGLLLVNPLLLSSIGLEVALGAAGIALLLRCAQAARPGWFGAVAGLLALTRLDLLIVVAVLLVARRRWWAGLWRAALAAVAVVLPWFAFSWLALGSAVPDTLIIKTSQSWGEYTFVDGWLLYLDTYRAAAVLSFVPVVLGLGIAAGWLVLRVVRPSETVRRLDAFAPLVIAAGLHFAAYAWLSVPPYHWYYGPSIVLMTIYVAAAAGCAATARAWPPLRAVLPAGALALLLASAAGYGWQGLPREHAPFTTNQASFSQYREIGADLAGLVGERIVRTAGEIGVLAYYCECSLVDAFSDRGEVEPMIAEAERESGPFGRWLLRLNFRYLDRTVPPLVPDLTLARTSGPAPAEAIASWPIDSPWAGAETLYLAPAAR